MAHTSGDPAGHVQDKEDALRHEHSKEILSFLSLASIKGVGFETLRSIARSNRTFSSIIELEDAKELAHTLNRFGAHTESNGAISWKDARSRIEARAVQLFEQMAATGTSLVFRSDPEYPSQLNDLKEAPHWLFVQGSTSVLSSTSLSVVGTREPSEDGTWLTKYIGHCLRDWAVPTVSGLALGIDQTIHQSSIRAGLPTIAFLGTGILSDYPRNSETLRNDIIRRGGAIVTEYLPSESYSAKNFVRRNRLQAALGKVLIPVEWALKSGTAHTVKFANELGRPIVYVRTPSQTDFSWVPSEYRRDSSCFALPSEHDRFIEYVRRTLKNTVEGKISQRSLF